MGVLKEFEPLWNKVLDNFSVDCISHIVNVKLQNVFLGISSCGSVCFWTKLSSCAYWVLVTNG